MKISQKLQPQWVYRAVVNNHHGSHACISNTPLTWLEPSLHLPLYRTSERKLTTTCRPKVHF